MVPSGQDSKVHLTTPATRASKWTHYTCHPRESFFCAKSTAKLYMKTAKVTQRWQVEGRVCGRELAHVRSEGPMSGINAVMENSMTSVCRLPP